MNEVSIPGFVNSIYETHGCTAALTGEQMHVREMMGDLVVWEGMVLIFDLRGHESADKCYAWSVDGRVTAVLHEGPVDSPKAAVRAAITAEHRR